MNHYPADSVVCFVNTYPLDSDLSGGQRYPAFEQPGQLLIKPFVLWRPRSVAVVVWLSSFLLSLKRILRSDLSAFFMSPYSQAWRQS